VKTIDSDAHLCHEPGQFVACPRSAHSRKSDHIARPEIRRPGSNSPQELLARAGTEILYFQSQYTASDVNHLEAIDLSCTVETHPKEKPGVREIRAVVDELVVVSLFEKRERLEGTQVRSSGREVSHGLLDTVEHRGRVVAIIRCPFREPEKFILNALRAGGVRIGLGLHSEQGDFGNIHSGDAENEPMGVGAEAVIEVRKHDHRGPLFRQHHDARARVTGMHDNLHSAIAIDSPGKAVIEPT